MANVSQAVAMPSSSRRHSGRHRAEPPSHSPAPSEPRDWTALPQDILITVFLKLGPREIMLGAEFVCTTWRRVAVGEALLWRRIDMFSVFHPARLAMARAALDRSAGQCEAFWASCDNELLLYLVGRAPSLKSLHLSTFDGSQVLVAVLKKLPLLEDLEVSPSLLTDNFLVTVCQACPHLRKLRIRLCTVEYGFYWMSDTIIGTFTRMSELRFLELLDCYLTAEGLTAILDRCPVLEDLYITGSFDGIMDAVLYAKCAKVKNLTLPISLDEAEYYWEGDCAICHQVLYT
ncbi:putative F-box/LRR-repeat protein 23 [Zea mays]|uniref:Putative F-box/LRR-repeat protein 23 n=1 Tax=Zea mays TaxID=4577 RepID=A0A3L6D7U0_MAIZE|nr:putative F-box/LRR-repeat protein 23 [Zea mays]